MAPPERGCTSDHSLLLIYRRRKDERMSWPSWLTYSGRFPHMWSPVSCRSSAEQGKFAQLRRPKTDVLPLCQATLMWSVKWCSEEWTYCRGLEIQCTVIIVQKQTQRPNIVDWNESWHSS